jgi:hypothetical protein
MNKLLVGVIAGAGLGLVDGMTAWFTPAIRPFLISVLVGSIFKDALVGLLSGVLARKVVSVPIGVSAGAGFGLLFAYGVAAMPAATGEHYYWEIMTPGLVVGALLGFLTQRWGAAK